MCRNECNEYCNNVDCNGDKGCRAFGYNYNTQDCLLFSAIIDPDTETPGDQVYCTKGKLYKSNRISNFIYN